MTEAKNKNNIYAYICAFNMSEVCLLLLVIFSLLLVVWENFLET